MRPGAGHEVARSLPCRPPCIALTKRAWEPAAAAGSRCEMHLVAGGGRRRPTRTGRETEPEVGAGRPAKDEFGYCPPKGLPGPVVEGGVLAGKDPAPTRFSGDSLVAAEGPRDA